MPTQLIGRAVSVVRDAGGDADALIQAFDLPPTVERDPFVVMSVPRLRAALDAAETASGHPSLGVHIALHYDDPNVIAFACRGAPDLRTALTRCVRIITSFNRYLLVSFEEHAGRGRIDMRIAGEPLCLGRHGNEYWVTTLLLHASRLSGEPRAPERVWLAHPAPRDWSAFSRAAGTSNVEFGRGSNGIEVTSSVLDQKLPTADPTLVELVDQYAKLMIVSHAGERPFVARVRQAMVERVPHGSPTLDDIARACGVSVRTLQRRLGESGSSFRSLLDAVRSDLSSMYVDDRGRKLQEIASLLGYGQASALVRAHRRWTGKTPRARS